MNRSTRLIALILLAPGVGFGCQRSVDSPVAPPAQINPAQSISGYSASLTARDGHTQLWGCYDVYLDFESRTIEAVPNRQIEFAANVVTFLNNDPYSVQFYINDTPVGGGYICADVNVSIAHPFPGMPEFNGYDVRGVFIGNGSCKLSYNSDLKYADWEDEQVLVNADGYTRWFNPPEFGTQGVLGYTRGSYAAPGYTGSATLNPYKYFSDNLFSYDDLVEYLASGYIDGTFSSGNTNERNYYLRFPFPNPGVKFVYAVVASWEGQDPSDHPAHAPEAIACDIADRSTLRYTSPTNIEGDLILDMSLFSFNGADGQPDSIFIDSPNLSEPYELTDEMNPIGGGENYSTYRVEMADFPADDSWTNECFVIAEYDDYDYTNRFGVTNWAGTDPLAAYFRHKIRIIDPNAGWASTHSASSGNEEGDCAVDGDGNVYVICGDTVLAKFDPNGGLIWDTVIGTGPAAGVDVDGEGNVYAIWGGPVSVGKFSPDGESIWEYELPDSYMARGIAVDDAGNVYIVGQCGEFFAAAYDTDGNLQWTITFGSGDYPQAHAIAIDDEHVYVSGRFWGILDVGDGNPVTSEGEYDVFLLTFDTDGELLWKKAFGGSQWDESRGVGAGNGLVFVSGSFNSSDFNRGDGKRVGTKGWLDVFVTCFNSTGAFRWSRIIGGTLDDRSWAIQADDSGVFAVTGFFESLNFDPGNGTSISTNGDRDIFLSSFDKDGDYRWSFTTGSYTFDMGAGVDVDADGSFFLTGQYGGSCDFAPTGSPCNNEPDIHGGAGTFIAKYLSDGCW